MMVFVARIIRHKLRMFYAFFDLFVQKSLLNKNDFLTAEINLTTLGPLYTCLVLFSIILCARKNGMKMFLPVTYEETP